MSDRDILLAAGTFDEASRNFRSTVSELREERGKIEWAVQALREERLKLEESKNDYHCASCDGHSCNIV